MKNDPLRNALSIVIEQDYSVFLCESKHSFSTRFEKRMNRLIQRERRPLWRYTNTFGKRLALTALLIVIFLAGLFSVSVKAREAAVQMIHRISSGHIDYRFQGTKSKPIEEDISFSSVPEGFEEIEYNKSPSDVCYRFQDSAGNIIELKQVAGEALGIDTEHHILKQVSVAGSSVDLYLCTIEQSMIAVWSIDRYIIILHIWGDYTEEQVLSWIPLVEIIN